MDTECCTPRVHGVGDEVVMWWIADVLPSLGGGEQTRSAAHHVCTEWETECISGMMDIRI